MTKSKQKIILVANPGSASRKYALYKAGKEVANLHFEWVDSKVVCHVKTKTDSFRSLIGVSSLDKTLGHIEALFIRANALQDGDEIDGIGLRVVAPSGYFLGNRKITPSVFERLKKLETVAPLHIDIVTKEFLSLEKYFKGIPIIGVSDSGFHGTKPDYAWNYGISLNDADKYEIKRFGYHGLSVESIVRNLKKNDRLANKVIIAHLGSGCSVTALHGGKSLDNTMGFSPLEGLMMATRSGTVDYSAIRALQIQKGVSDHEMEQYLNRESGLLGVGGSSDIRQLLDMEADGSTRAKLALDTFVYGVQKGIAQMTAALGGVDAIVFTGTVGERSFIMRKRILARMGYLDFKLDTQQNQKCTEPLGLEVISDLGKSKPIYVIHADEAAEIARQAAELI